MEKLLIKGKTKLKGEVVISGAKNAAVAILPATLLINGKCTINNLPNISDIKLWQRNYFEHIIRNEKEYLEICKYMKENPIKYYLNKFNII